MMGRWRCLHCMQEWYFPPLTSQAEHDARCPGKIVQCVPRTGVMWARRRGWRRARQLAMRAWCALMGHDWADPFQDEGTSSRRCERGCGALEMTRWENG